MATPGLAQPGSPDQLPRGEASQVIKRAQETVAHPGIPEDAGTSGPTGSGTDNFGNPVQQNVNPVGPDRRDYNVPQGNVNLMTFRPTSEIDKFLFGPSMRPNESVAAGVSQAAPLPVPQAAYDILPALQQAALSPDAPPQIQALLNLLMHHMGR